MEKGNPERKKLKINSVGKVETKARKDGQGTFDTINFNADDITDTEVKKGYSYSVANPVLVPIIEASKKDDVLEADVRKLTGEKGDGQGWTIHQVVQLYKDGQPTAGQKKSWGKSVETVKLEIESRAKNTALMQASELAKASVIKTEEILKYADKFLNWLQSGIEESKPTQTQKVKTPAPQPTEDLFPQETALEATKSKSSPADKPVNGNPPEEDIKTWDELVEWLVISMGWKDGTYARTWMVNNGIDEDKLTDIDYCVKEIKQLQGW